MSCVLCTKHRGDGGNICGAWLSKVTWKQTKGRFFLGGQERESGVEYVHCTSQAT
jgi:hypothetical protein